MNKQELIRWHLIIQNILDEYLWLLSGKKIREGKADREFSKFIKIDYFCEVEGDLPASELGKTIIRPFCHFKQKNLVEYKSMHESLNEATFRHYVMRALAVETSQPRVSYQGQVTLTILTTKVPKMLISNSNYAVQQINKWKFQSHWIKDLDIFISVYPFSIFFTQPLIV